MTSTLVEMEVVKDSRGTPHLTVVDRSDGGVRTSDDTVLMWGRRRTSVN